MRLSPYEVSSIKKAFAETFKEGKIYLFGSRVNDAKRGGDIDLYLCPTMHYDNEGELKTKFLVTLMDYIGEQKIDVIIAKDPSRPIEQAALRDGVEL